MRIKNLLLFVFLILMGIAFVSCNHEDDEIPCVDCKKVNVSINVVNIDGQPLSRTDKEGYTTFGEGTYDTDQTPEVGAEAKSGYNIIGFVCDTQYGGNTLNWSGSAKRKTHTANGKNGNHIYTVTVESEQKYTNTVVASLGGTAIGTYTGITGSTHSIEASANNDYKFKNWSCTGGASVANSISAKTTATIGSSDGTITANFENQGYNDVCFDIIVGEKYDFEQQSGGRLSGTCVDFESTGGVVKHTNDPKDGFYTLMYNYLGNFPSLRVKARQGYKVVGWARDEQEAAEGVYWPYCNDPCNLTADDIEAMARECPSFCLVVEYIGSPTSSTSVYIEERTNYRPEDFSNIHWNWFDPQDYDFVFENRLVNEDGASVGEVKLYDSTDHTQYVGITNRWSPIPYTEYSRPEEQNHDIGSWRVKFKDVQWHINGECFYLYESLVDGAFFADKINKTFTGSDGRTYTIKCRK